MIGGAEVEATQERKRNSVEMVTAGATLMLTLYYRLMWHCNVYQSGGRAIMLTCYYHHI